MTNGNAEETTFSKIVPYFDSIKKNVNFEQIADKLVASSLLLPDEFHHIASIPLNSDKVAHYLDTILPKRESVTFLEVLRQANYAWISDEILPAKQLPFALNGRKEKKRTSTVPRTAVIKKAKSVTDDDEVDASVIEAAGVPMDEDVCGNRAMEKASVPATPPLTVNTNNNTTLTKIDKSSEKLTKDVINMASKSNYLLRRWMSLCHHLELDSEEHTIRMHLATNPQDSSMPIIHLLKAWKEQNPKQATVGNLIKNLRELKANELADDIEEFCP